MMKTSNLYLTLILVIGIVIVINLFSNQFFLVIAVKQLLTIINYDLF